MKASEGSNHILEAIKNKRMSKCTSSINKKNFYLLNVFLVLKISEIQK